MIAVLAASWALASPPEVQLELAVATRRVSVARGPDFENRLADGHSALPPLGGAVAIPVHKREDGRGVVLVEIGGTTERTAWGWEHRAAVVRQWDLRVEAAAISLPGVYERGTRRIVRPYLGASAGLNLAWFHVRGAPDLVAPAPRVSAIVGTTIGSAWPRLRVELRPVVIARIDQYDYVLTDLNRLTELVIRPGGVGINAVAGVGFR